MATAVSSVPSALHEIAFVGNYVPRKCGIATFTTDLCEAIAEVATNTACYAVAMNDEPEGYPYPERVHFEVDQQRREHYDLAADFLNISRADAVCVQHEYGIYGGDSGRYLVSLMSELRAPIVTTLHTVLKEPTPSQYSVLRDVVSISDRVVVMSPRAVEYMHDVYGVADEKVRMIHHGIPDMPFVDPNYYKDQFGVEGRPVILTFGLLSPNKGVEYMIEAMPRVVEAVPDAVYIILGATHPHVKRTEGEAYRLQLHRRVRELDMEDHVVFQNRFVDLRELCEYLGAADVYITPYLNPAQITSGTLAYALGVGKAVVSTPYWYAEDMLADERGALVPFSDSNAIAEQVVSLFENEVERHAMRKRAYQYGRDMIWRQVAREYLALMNEVREERAQTPRPTGGIVRTGTRRSELPELKAQHLLTLTDTTGIIQHAKFTVPDLSHGYSSDDQARALMVAVKAEQRFPRAADWHLLTARYLSFLLYAFDDETRRFRNFMSYGHEWLEGAPVEEDVHARSLWGLGHVVAHAASQSHVEMAARLMEAGLEEVTAFTSPRAWAATVMAIQLYLHRFSGASVLRRTREELAGRLKAAFTEHATEEWPWLEDRLTYANARLAQVLIEAGKWVPDDEMIEIGLTALAWLDEVQTAEEGHFVPIGSDGWYVKDGPRARFDQQPIEAYTMLDAALCAYRVTRDTRWLRVARRAFDWFLGRNDLRVAVYDYTTGGCFDGLQPVRLNRNQGAESTVVWLLSLLTMHELEDELQSNRKSTDTPTDRDHVQ